MLNANVEIRDIDELARFLEEMLLKYGGKIDLNSLVSPEESKQ